MANEGLLAPNFLQRLQSGIAPQNDLIQSLLGPAAIREAQRRSTLALGLGLLQGGGPSTTPTNFGQIAGQALSQGQQAGDQFVQQQLQNNFAALQLQNQSRRKPEELVTLVSPDGQTISLRKGSPDVDRAIAQGFTVRGPNAQPKNAVNVITPDNENFLSLDGGRNIVTGQNDQGPITQPTPPGSRIGTLQGGTEDLGISSNRIDDLIGERDLFVQASDQIDTLLGDISKDPTVVGAGGSLRAGAKTVFGVGGDIGNLLTGSGFDGVTQIASQEFGKSLRAGDITDKEAGEIVTLISNPNLSKLELFENNIGLILARSRVGEGRLPVDVIKRSIEDVRLTGFTSSGQAVDRLKEIKSILNRRVSDLENRIGDQPKLVQGSDGIFRFNQ